jgi:hypothetical protein
LNGLDDALTANPVTPVMMTAQRVALCQLDECGIEKGVTGRPEGRRSMTDPVGRPSE